MNTAGERGTFSVFVRELADVFYCQGGGGGRESVCACLRAEDFVLCRHTHSHTQIRLPHT